MPETLIKKENKKFHFFGDFKAETANGATRIKGYASTWDVDRGNDKINPKAFDTTIADFMTNPVILINHENNTKCVLGHVEALRIDDKGLYIEAVLTEAEENAGDVQKIREGHLKAFSIGGYFIYNPNGPDDKGIYEIVQIKLFEISVVAVPMNGEALFGVKSFSDFEAEVKKGVDRNQAIKMLESIKSSQVLNDADKQKALTMLEGIITPKQLNPQEGKQMKTAEELQKELEAKDAEIAALKLVKPSVEVPVAGKTVSVEDVKNLVAEGIKAAMAEVKDIVVAGSKSAKKFQFELPVDGKSVKFESSYKTKENLTKTDKMLIDLLCNRKALSDGGAATGAEFIPTELASEFIDLMRIPETIPSLFQSIDMPSNPYNVPVSVSDPVWNLAAENNTDTGARYIASTPGTGKLTFTAVKLTARVAVSEEFNEDSIIPVLDFLKVKIAISAVEMLSEVILDGDTASSHQDSDVSASTDRRKAFNGLRKLALAVAGLKTDLATFNTTNLRKMRGTMGKYGVDATQLAWIVGVSGYVQMRSLAEISTVQNAGQAIATIVNGKLSQFDGIDVIVSGKVRENLNASGVYDGSTVTKTYVTLVNKGRFMIGNRREMTIKVKEDFDDSQYIAASIRKDFEPVNTPSATVKSVAIGYNLTA